MTKKIPASRFMTPEVIVANPKTRLSDILEFFDLYKIQHLPVAENDKLLGLISVNDVMNYISKQLRAGKAMNMDYLNQDFYIHDVMTINPSTVHPDEDFGTVVKLLSDGKFQCVPVVKDGLLLGIITNKDVVRVYAEESVYA